MVNREHKEYLVSLLRQYRIDNTLTYQLLADELDLPRPTVSAWLNRDNYPGEIACARLEKFLTEKGYIQS